MYKWTDLLSTDDWALAMVPGPVLAVVLLFPIKDASEAAKKEQEDRIRAEGQAVPDSLWYTKQVVGNACGTIGLLHSVANSSETCGGGVPLREGSWFKQFLETTKDMSPEERGDALEDDDGIEEEHEASAQEGQSEVVQQVNTHFVAFVEKDGSLFELDGRKAFPVNHGATSADSFLADACAAVKREFMEKDPAEMRFTLLALANAAEE